MILLFLLKQVFLKKLLTINDTMINSKTPPEITKKVLSFKHSDQRFSFPKAHNELKKKEALNKTEGEIISPEFAKHDAISNKNNVITKNNIMLISSNPIFKYTNS